MDLVSWACNRESAPPCLFFLLSKVREGTREGELLPLSSSFSVSSELCSGDTVGKKRGKGERRRKGTGKEEEGRVGRKGEGRREKEGNGKGTRRDS